MKRRDIIVMCTVAAVALTIAACATFRVYSGKIQYQDQRRNVELSADSLEIVGKTGVR